MIEMISYVSVCGVDFGATRDDVIARFGSPLGRWADIKQSEEFHYDGFILRFDSGSGGLRECTLLPNCSASLNGYPIPWDERFLAFLQSKDKNLKVVVGFVYSLELGISVTGFHAEDDRAIHLFRRGEMDDLIDQSQQFVLQA